MYLEEFGTPQGIQNQQAILDAINCTSRWSEHQESLITSGLIGNVLNNDMPEPAFVVPRGMVVDANVYQTLQDTLRQIDPEVDLRLPSPI